MFSGIQPTGNLHLGNYLGAIKPYTDLKKDYQSLFCIADLHSLTRKPTNLNSTIGELVKVCMALELHENSTLFLQSTVTEHTQLYYMLSCITYTGELSRMTQYKDKSQASANAGLFTYPVLMASDILLYGTHKVPVGVDQTQHMELTRHLAVRFNKTYGNVFTVPEIHNTSFSKVYSLQYPDRKMSKSDDDPHGVIYFSDTKDKIANKVKRATTDSGSSVEFINQSPAIINLLDLYAELKGVSFEVSFNHFKGAKYGALKEELTELIESVIAPVRSTVKQITDYDVSIQLENGATVARSLAKPRMLEVYNKVYNKS
jgi:tryptophanyl-tRNA synthetase